MLKFEICVPGALSCPFKRHGPATDIYIIAEKIIANLVAADAAAFGDFA